VKQRKDYQIPQPKRPESQKSVRELAEQITQIVGKDPKKAARAIEFWVKDSSKTRKKAA